jgi:ribosomal-protein-alanine N-acetyltransferase
MVAPRFELPTSRLTLVGADDSLLQAELAGPAALAAASGAAVPANWPPEHHDRGVIEWLLASLESIRPDTPWRFYYMVLAEPRTLIGTCGIKQAPGQDGCVEIGYSVLEQFRDRGLATEAAMALMDAAFAAGASEVAAQTFPSLLASIRVMEKSGMIATGEGSEPGTLRYSRRRGEER